MDLYSQHCLTLVLLRFSRSAVGIATGYRLDDRGVAVRVRVVSRTFSSLRSDWFWGPPSLLSHGCRCSFPGEKRPGLEADSSPQTSANVKKLESTHPFPRTPPWRSAKLVKHRSNYIFCLVYTYTWESIRAGGGDWCRDFDAFARFQQHRARGYSLYADYICMCTVTWLNVTTDRFWIDDRIYWTFNRT
jgi:hypothetical protein